VVAVVRILFVVWVYNFLELKELPFVEKFVLYVYWILFLVGRVYIPLDFSSTNHPNNDIDIDMVKNNEDTIHFPNTNYFPNKIASYYSNQVELLFLIDSLELESYHHSQLLLRRE
jgi:hypothetical protein